MAASQKPVPLTAYPAVALRGTTGIPGDKSISHRALILGALSVGETRINGLLEGEDVLATAEAVRMLGADLERRADGEWRIHGVGTGGFTHPGDVIDCGNSGTGVRLLMGAVCTNPITAVFTGDESLRSRPMRRVIEPLSEFGARFISSPDGRLPVTVIGSDAPLPINHRMTTASAQVKSAILLAGLNAPGQTVIVEAHKTRDHSERMLRSFGAGISVEEDGDTRIITLSGFAELEPQHLTVPGDPSSAAFLIATALMVEASAISLTGIGMNPTRVGFLDTIREMGAELDFSNSRLQGGEPVADISVSFSSLRGIEVPPERAPTMIDEYPVLAALAACADGNTVMRGISELRLKESDRIDAMARGLEACGVEIIETDDSLTVHGRGPGSVAGGAVCATRLDHRIAMSFLCLGLAAQSPVSIDDSTAIATSFPNFLPLMHNLGADIRGEPIRG
ncbi:MAG: 3-phosphoshikimate 1-carboxyvinyltransferase [Rhodobacteraceae bacterium]|nr:3-phosphoshikimate 1-carboxyvinyltransferase [Paracoccaceae bacterium]